MKQVKLLIVGIDPGTTLGYALLDTEGNILKLESCKHLSLNELISKVIKVGKPVVVGCDKKNVPSFVEKFSASVGARLILPKEDIPVKEKLKLTAGSKTKDFHQIDALASAVYAFKSIRSLLKKIKSFVQHYHAEGLEEKIKELVLLRGVSIREAFTLVQEPEKKVEKVKKKIVKEKNLDKSVKRKLERLKIVEKEVELVRKQNKDLKDKLERLNKLYRYLNKKIASLSSDEKLRELLSLKEKRIFGLTKEIELKEEEIESLKQELRELRFFLSQVNSSIVVKKLRNFGLNEFERKNPILNIQDHDVLLVEEPNIVSKKVIDLIKEKVRIVIYKKRPKEELPFIFIDSKKLEIKEGKYFGIVDKNLFNKIVNKFELLEKIVKEYRKERFVK